MTRTKITWAKKPLKDGDSYVLEQSWRYGDLGWDERTTCCDCGLTHRYTYKLLEDERLLITVWRDEDYTRAHRARWKMRRVPRPKRGKLANRRG